MDWFACGEGWRGIILVASLSPSLPSLPLSLPLHQQIKDQQYDEAMQLLQEQLERNPQSRPALSLMAYCAYHVQDFATAVEW